MFCPDLLHLVLLPRIPLEEEPLVLPLLPDESSSEPLCSLSSPAAHRWTLLVAGKIQIQPRLDMAVVPLLYRDRKWLVTCGNHRPNPRFHLRSKRIGRDYPFLAADTASFSQATKNGSILFRTLDSGRSRGFSPRRDLVRSRPRFYNSRTSDVHSRDGKRRRRWTTYWRTQTEPYHLRHLVYDLLRAE